MMGKLLSPPIKGVSYTIAISTTEEEFDGDREGGGGEEVEAGE